MPVIGVGRDKLFQRLGDEFTCFGAAHAALRTSTRYRRVTWYRSGACLAGESQMDEAEKKFDELCFQYGIELDDVVCCRRQLHLLAKPRHTSCGLAALCIESIAQAIVRRACILTRRGCALHVHVSCTLELMMHLVRHLRLDMRAQTSEEEMVRKEHGTASAATANLSKEVIYKIDIPANRYDMLCLEGIARALNVFRGVSMPPRYTLADMRGKQPQQLVVERETALIRPFVVSAVLRGVTFDQSNYASFIDLQDKLHQNLCRQRSLVAIGTHNLDTLQVLPSDGYESVLKF